MRTFKTICHNNIHRDYTDELIKPDGNLQDWRPTFQGELRIIYSENGLTGFEEIKLVVGNQYELLIDDMTKCVYVMLNKKPCLVICGKDNVMHLGYDRIDSLDYFEFFYTEIEMRDNKINEILE